MNSSSKQTGFPLLPVHVGGFLHFSAVMQNIALGVPDKCRRESLLVDHFTPVRRL